MVHLFAQIAKALAFKNKQRYKNYSQAKHIHQALQHHRAYSFIYRYVFVAGQHTTTAYFAQAWKKQVQEIHHLSVMMMYFLNLFFQRLISPRRGKNRFRKYIIITLRKVLRKPGL